ALCTGGYAFAVAQSATPANPAAAPAVPVPQPTSADSPLLSEPKTPVEAFDAAVLTQRLYRPALTKRYLQKFLQSNPSDAVFLELRDRYGSSVFLQFAHDPALKPEG